MANNPPSVSPDPTTDSSGSHFGCLMVALALFLSGAAVLWFVFIGPLLQTRQAAYWVETPCTVTVSNMTRVRSSHHEDAETYQVTTPQDSPAQDPYLYSWTVQYEYEYEGRKYSGDRESFRQEFDRYRREKEERCLQFPVGTKTECYVNPLDPTDSVLRRELEYHTLSVVLASGLTLLGVFGMALVAIGWRLKPQSPPAATT